MFFVNLNLRKAFKDPTVLEAFFARGVNPELGLDPVLMDMVDLDWHRAMAAELKARGLTPALHLPFFDLQPGSADSLVLGACRERLCRAMEVAMIYEPAHMIGHVKYDHLLYMHTYPQWRDRAVVTWQAMMDAWPDHPPLYLENTFEPDPATVAGVVEKLLEERPGRAGLCLDVGHWYSFSEGHRLDNLDAWLDAFAPLLSHLHLHDNDGSFDQHKGLGQGEIPWQAFFEGLQKRGLTPSVTFEPHSDDAFEAAMEFVRGRPEWFEPLNVVAPGA
ncbi:sugar phosphate isomerase/epimerase family protein [Fundidesulfovibrio terrae]|uniref:sugar phosphate isomerase/epimerase family protein n=1 Tax=Fundidesulfovibrio terrae TaxID=2922866 RepID=UPI001FAF1AB8|nr:sugar phosphate isomerase/epimerase [Fundidesulfovibrio terrae]